MRTLLYIACSGTEETPLDKTGFVIAHEQHQFFLHKPWRRIFSADTKRSVQVAKIIAGNRPEEIEPAIAALRNAAEVSPLLAEAIQIGMHHEPPIIVAHDDVAKSLYRMLIGDSKQPGSIVEVYLEDGEIKVTE